MKILAATNNAHKLEELKEILGPQGIEVISGKEAGGIPEVIEDKDTFEGNASKKAIETAQAKNMFVFSDDSGLCVEALDGRPGVYSARYAGENATDTDRMNKLLGELEGKETRAAKFVCTIALATPEGLIGTATGECHGTIASAPQGNEGFGYDPLFIPDGYDKTFAELGEDIKNKLSHRGNALKKAISQGFFK
ncbi:MAG: RdgB/HAM1 family non-canonical purine NTP pyrophosphatase [Lentisphaeraceae bacterium]|nr:RdgB/HAM1 family non-canonical purine NTP pyrophosphatase [Lentisphaeraceae bacterium]